MNISTLSYFTKNETWSFQLIPLSNPTRCFLMEVAHFEMLWKWTLISDHSNHLPNFFYCTATYVTSQVLQPKSVNKLYRGRHTFISFNCFFNLGQSRPLFISWPFSHHNSITNWKSVDVVLGIQTRGHRMVGTDGSTELYMQRIGS